MKIIWTDFAVANLKQIFDYYAEKAGKKVAHRIKKQLLDAAKQLKKHPESGQVENHLPLQDFKYRALVCGNYKIIYRTDNEEIVINDVFDARQNPTKMNDENRLL